MVRQGSGIEAVALRSALPFCVVEEVGREEWVSYFGYVEGGGVLRYVELSVGQIWWEVVAGV